MMKFGPSLLEGYMGEYPLKCQNHVHVKQLKFKFFVILQNFELSLFLQATLEPSYMP